MKRIRIIPRIIHTVVSLNGDIKLSRVNGHCRSRNHDVSCSRSFLQEYTIPAWGAGLKGIPTHKVKLAQYDTPIQQWNLPGVPNGFEVFIKRDDLTGSVLSGNKVRNLEFMFAEAIQQGCTSVITFGFVNSNFLRAAAICARTLRMQIHILVKTDDVKETDSLPCKGNALLYNMVGAQLYFIPWNSRYDEDVLPRLKQLANKLREKTNEKPYLLIPYKHPWVFGYVDGFHEILANGKSDKISDIVCATAQGGTISGLIAGNHLTGNPFRIHGMVANEKSSTQHKLVNKVLQDLALQCSDGTGLKSEDAWTHIDEALGEGYAVASPELLEFIMKVAEETGIILDPVYTGKAVYCLVKQLINNPEQFKGNKILYIHTGGVFSLFDGRMQPVFDAKNRNNKPRLWNELKDSVPFSL